MATLRVDAWKRQTTRTQEIAPPRSSPPIHPLYSLGSTHHHTVCIDRFVSFLVVKILIMRTHREKREKRRTSQPTKKAATTSICISVKLSYGTGCLAQTGSSLLLLYPANVFMQHALPRETITAAVAATAAAAIIADAASAFAATGGGSPTAPTTFLQDFQRLRTYPAVTIWYPPGPTSDTPDTRIRYPPRDGIPQPVVPFPGELVLRCAYYCVLVLFNPPGVFCSLFCVHGLREMINELTIERRSSLSSYLPTLPLPDKDVPRRIFVTNYTASLAPIAERNGSPGEIRLKRSDLRLPLKPRP